MGTTDFNPMDILLFIFINTYFSPLIGDNAAMSRQNIPGCLLRVVKKRFCQFLYRTDAIRKKKVQILYR